MFTLETIAAALSPFENNDQPFDQAKMQQELDNLRIRNQKRMEAIKKQMGTKYILHPSHMKSKLDEPRPV
jgi:molecular chaperone GrpE (heat shock protein)